MNALRLFPLLFLAAALSSVAQTPPQTFLGNYVGASYLVRQYGGQDNTIKVRKSDITKYKGKCDRAVEVKDVTFEKRTLQFEVQEIGEVLAPDISCSADFVKRVVITDLSGQETPSELATVIGRVLLTPEAYLTSYGLTPPSPVDDAEVPLMKDWRSIGQAPNALLKLDVPNSIFSKKGPLQVEANGIVGRDGRLHELRITSGQGSGLDQAWLKIWPLFRFTPPQFDGKTVAVPTNFKVMVPPPFGRP